MRNLKRALSLAMASIMVLGLMVVGASAIGFDDFSDKDKIVNTEAVSILNSLNIINGKDDGSYDPTGIVTRAEMAKMICVALSGGKDPQLGNATTNSYKDTAGNWAAAYIEYCTVRGIVSGDGAGNFNPTKAVTGTEASKMLAVAIGFDAVIEKFVGAQWAINVNTVANDKDFYKGLDDLNPSEGLTRDNAAQMIYNAIKAGKVKYETNLVTDGTTISTVSTRVDYTFPQSAGTDVIRTILNDNYGVDTYQGVLLANEYAAIDGSGAQKAGQVRFQPTMINDNAAYALDRNNNRIPASPMTVQVNTTLDMLGKNVTLLIKDSKVNNVYTKVYGTPYVNDSNNIYTVSAGKTNEKTFTSDIKAKNITNVVGAKYVLNYVDQNSTISSWANLMSKTGNGYVITVIDNDNDQVADYVMDVTTHIGQVTAYNEKGNSGDGSITVSNKGSYTVTGENISNEKFANVVGVEDVEKDDIVSFIKLANDKYYVTKLEAVEGTVKATTGFDKVNLDGTNYTLSALARTLDESNTTVARNNAGDLTVGLKDTVTVGKDAKLYLDASGYVVYVEAVEGATNYLYISALEAIGSISGVNAKAVFADGTTATIKINSVTEKVSGSNVKFTPKAAGNSDNLLAYDNANPPKVTGINPSANLDEKHVYTYSVKSDGTYDLKTMDATGKNMVQFTLGNIKKGTPTIGVGVNTAVADSKTVFVVKDGDSWTVYTGINNVPTMQTNQVGATVGVDKTAAVVFVDAGTIAGDRKSVYILDGKATATQDAKGNDIYTYKALVDGEWTELEVDGKPNGMTKGLYFDDRVNPSSLKVSVNDNKWDASSAPTASNPVKITGIKNNVVTGYVGTATGNAGPISLSITDDTKIILIDGADKDDISVGSIGDLVYDSATGHPASTVAIMVRASVDPSEADYGVAGYIYVIMP